MSTPSRICSPDDDALESLCRELARRADATDAEGSWPSEQLRLCGEYGVYEWFLPEHWGGQGWSDVDIVRGYLRLSAVCLTTTFIITQRTGACRRIAACDNDFVKQELLPGLTSGERFATLGISHLTTSGQHLSKPVLCCREVDGDFELDGFSPWVTGGVHAETIVTGAVMEDRRQVLLALPTDLPGVRSDEPAKLVTVFKTPVVTRIVTGTALTRHDDVEPTARAKHPAHFTNRSRQVRAGFG